jgi:hypothetical protein
MGPTCQPSLPHRHGCGPGLGHVLHIRGGGGSTLVEEGERRDEEAPMARMGGETVK